MSMPEKKDENLASSAEATQSSNRLNTEWAFAVALREVIGIALKGESQPTYLQTLSLAQELFPKLFNENSLLLRQEESDVAREYRQMAQAESKDKEQRVSPLELLDTDIKKYKRLVDTSLEVDTDKLRQRLLKMEIARLELSENKHTEQQLILRDAIRTERKYPLIGSGRDYREFGLPHDRVLRIRVLHPDRPEHLMGADVIYENYWNEKKLVRVAALQYKVWEDKTLHREPRMTKQIERLKRALCNRGYCQAQDKKQSDGRYRLPYCSAFLRPTNKLQKSDSKLVSTGYHVPICVVERIWQGGSQVTSKRIRSEAVTHKVFEELFNINMLGSRHITYEEIEELYREMDILNGTETIMIHAQELG